ncbi:MAG: N-acyl-D-amino-acid deacylase [Blastocatellia bacterium]|jgi:N-acyl-D-amino-acid deacylase|nr:N-acyl-D-amino-acid deacylase [Blastocatellia bacterium]
MHRGTHLLSRARPTGTFVFIGLTVFFVALALVASWQLWFRRSSGCSGNFDLAIIGGQIVDGLGGRSFKADIGIRDKRIACIGIVDPKHATEVIDATRLTITPGFIDVHTHVERNIPTRSEPFLAPNFIRQGVTTIITGNCGRSFLEIGKAFKQLEANGMQINLASFLGHNTVRQHVMSDSAAVPTAEQLIKMKGLVSAGMRDGALGISTGLEYIPGAFAKTDEIVELAKTVKAANGLYASHIRDEGTKGISAIREAISIGERTGIHVHISHFKAQGPNQWGTAEARLALVKTAEESGLVVSLDQYPYTASSTNIGVLLPSWVSAGGSTSLKQRLNDPATRGRLRTEMLEQLKASGWKDYSFARVSYCGFDHSIVGLRIPEIARTHDLSAPHKNGGNSIRASFSFDPIKLEESDLDRQADTVIDLFSHGDAQMVFDNMNEEDVETIMKDPEVMFGSDSGVREAGAQGLPHPRGFGTFPRILGLYAREKQLFSIEEAVRRMTSLPAATFGLHDRGQIKEGFYADLVVFDSERIIDTATYDKPLSNPEGIYTVIINGSQVIDKNRLTKSLPGMVIRSSDGPAR